MSLYFPLNRLAPLMIVMVGQFLCAAAHADVQAERINQNNAAKLVRQGPDAIGGIDDWFISNGTLCAVISDIAHESELSKKGGVLVDLGFCDRADDHFTSTQDMLDGKQSRPLEVNHIEFNKGRDWVSVVTQARADGAILQTTYTLRTDKPTQLFISKKLRVTDERAPGFNFYTPVTFSLHSLEPYVFSTRDLSQNKGFNNQDFVTRGVSAISDAAHFADMIIYPGLSDAQHPIAYGWQLHSARRVSSKGSYDVPSFVLADEESTAMMVLADTFYFGDGSGVGLLQLLQIPFLSMDKNEHLESEEVIYVAGRADVAAITDQIWSNASDVTGRVDDPKSALHIELADGTPVTFVRPRQDGTVAFKLKPGDYRIRHVGDANRIQEHLLTVEDANTDLGHLALPVAALVTLPRGEAMRLVFKGLDGTADPDFDDRLTGFTVTDDQGSHGRKPVSQLFLAGIDSDPKTIRLAAGSYRVYATRGPEYSLSTTDISVAAAAVTELKIKIPQQVVKTPGYIASDLHVHSGLSFDNAFPTHERVRTFVAEHGEVMVSSDHDVPVDFAPIIVEMDVTDKITSIPAVEMTSLLPSKMHPYTGGHVNFFPVSPVPYAYRKGMFNHEDKRLREVLHDVRQRLPMVLAQLNHARYNLDLSGELPDDYQDRIRNGEYLDHMGVAGHPYNPTKPLDSYPNNSLIDKDPATGVRDIDLDAMEIINPGGKYHHERVQALRKDWMSFLRQGIRLTGTANSDSHHANEQVAVPRNMVAVRGDSVASFDQTEFLSALKAGNMYGTTGPMIDLSLSGVAMGGMFKGSKATLEMSVDAADWIPVETLTVQINGETVRQIAVDNKRDVTVELAFTQDSFVTVEVSGPPSESYAAVYPWITPYAFSNPIYVDFDADGKWTAPGL